MRPVARLQLVMSTRASNSSSFACRTARLKTLRLDFAPESLAKHIPETVVSCITRLLRGGGQESPLAGLVVPDPTRLATAPADFNARSPLTQLREGEEFPPG